MSENVRQAGRIWALIQRDTDLLSGLAVGQLEDLMQGVAELMGRDEIRRGVSMTAMLAASRLGRGMTDVEKVLEAVSTICRDPAIRVVLDDLATPDEA